uniref:Uncharacterized protein n=1 Tax=Peronospora matthiolae TaxID=2874970 RepID=A0AAV1UTA0_9STRA
MRLKTLLNRLAAPTRCVKWLANVYWSSGQPTRRLKLPSLLEKYRRPHCPAPGSCGQVRQMRPLWQQKRVCETQRLSHANQLRYRHLNDLGFRAPSVDGGGSGSTAQLSRLLLLQVSKQEHMMFSGMTS